MAMTKLATQVGVNAQASKLAAHNQWHASNLIRFKDGFLQKLGGCQRMSNTPVVGICRGLHAFEDLSNVDYLAIGTDQRLQLLSIPGDPVDITPLRATTTPTAPFTTTLHAMTVTVTDAGHGALNGDWVDISGGSAVGGLTIAGFYQIAGATANTYTITAATPATSGATGGGTPSIAYLIHSDIANTGPVAYGQGLYGVGPYGIGGQDDGGYTLRQWSLDNWGQDLVGCHNGGPPYVWIPPITGGNVAAVIIGTGVPLALNGLFVAMPERQIFGYGADVGGVQDPLLIRFCDIEDYTDWTASATNQAGSFRLSSGSGIIGAFQMSQSSLFWTDIDLWAAQYIGYPLVYGFNKVGSGCGLIGKRAAGLLSSVALWMSQSNFFIWDGTTVSALPCAVWDEVFQNIDTAFTDTVTAAPNSFFDEMGWFYPTIGSMGVPSSYVKFNLIAKTWDYGNLTRVAWIDQSAVGAPVGVDGNNLIQQHEVSNDLDGQPMDAWAETGWFDISDGTVAVFMERILPDMILSNGATILVTIEAVNYVGDTPRVYGPYPITQSTPYVIVRARGRFASVRIESQDLGSFWRLGEFLYVTAPAGRRP